MASAKKQKNGRYQRSVKIGVDGDGKPIPQVLHCHHVEGGGCSGGGGQATTGAGYGRGEHGYDLFPRWGIFGPRKSEKYKCRLSWGSDRRDESVLENNTSIPASAT